MPAASVDVLAMTATAVYMPVWFTVGIVTEARIIVPFLLLLCVPVAHVLTRLLPVEAAERTA